MKVLHVIPSVSVVHGGPTRAMADIEHALAARGIEVTTATTNDDGQSRKLVVRCGVPIRTGDATRWYFPRTTVFYKSSVGLAQWLRRNVRQFDVVHAHALFSFAPVAAAAIARRARVPYVLRPIGVLNCYGMQQHHPLFKRGSLALIERPLIEAASAVHFTSRAEQREAASLNLNCRGAVIPLGIEIGAAAKPSADAHRDGDASGRTLLFLSRIDPKKNLEGLLRALSRLAPRYPDLTVDIAGDGRPDYVLRLKSLAAELQVSDRVRWHGHVEGQAKADLFARATAFVLPSFSENFGIAVVEALAAGLPCIVSREVAVHEEIEKASAGVIVGLDPESIAVGIESLLSKESRYPALRSAALSLAREQFSLAAMGERLETLYRTITSGDTWQAAAAAAA